MRLRVLGVLVLSALALAACEQGGGAAGGKAKAGYPDCRSDDLALKLVSEEAGTATYRFENRSRRICVLKGAPAMAFVGADGRPIEVKTETRETSTVPDTGVRRREAKVVLRPGRRANFAVSFPEKSAGATCGRFVKVTATPPGSDWGLDVVQTGEACDGVGVSTFWYDSSETL